MPRRKTTEEFIADARRVHGERYNYTHAVYVNNATKVKIICVKHGPFFQAPRDHIWQKQGCAECSGVKKLTTPAFVKKAKAVHGDKYDYSLVEYNGNKSSTKIICRDHGVFNMRPNSHLTGQGCPKCGKENATEKRFLGLVKFLELAKQAHGDKYDYSLSNYIHSHKKITVICKQHGPFKQTPIHHYRGRGCRRCAASEKAAKEKVGTTEFIKNARNVHGDTYDYSLVRYERKNSKVQILCKQHGPFKQTPNNHISSKAGCPRCRSSKGEKQIELILGSLKIDFIREAKFDKCKDKRLLPFDFYIPYHKLLIEFDGQQHTKAICFYGGEESLKATQKRDRVKNNFAEKHGLKLLRIPYTDYERIEEILLVALRDTKKMNIAGGQLQLFAA